MTEIATSERTTPSPALPLAGRVAVVTGAASGIGAAAARLLAARGAKVALLARRRRRLEALAEELPGALAVAADVSRADELERAAATVAEALGTVDLLVAGAGVMLPGPIEEGRADEWQRMLDANLTGLLLTTRAFVPALLDAAERGPADLIVVSSIGSHVAFPRYAVYGATKAAATAFADGIRKELAGRDVRVTALEPGLTATELADHVSDEAARAGLDRMFEELPALSADDVAEVIAFIAGRPAHVNLSRLIVLPTRQTW